MSDKPELKPCPFWHIEKDYEHELSVIKDPEHHGLARVCCRCGYRSPVMGFDKESVIKAHNSLADPIRRFENVNDAIFTESELSRQLSEATKEIDQLRADLAKPSEWTSVATPPEYNVPVLIYNPGWNFVMVARLCQVAGSKDDRWYSIPGWGHELKPTEWHELPVRPTTCGSDMHELCTEDQRKRCKV